MGEWRSTLAVRGRVAGLVALLLWAVSLGASAAPVDISSCEAGPSVNRETAVANCLAVVSADTRLLPQDTQPGAPISWSDAVNANRGQLGASTENRFFAGGTGSGGGVIDPGMEVRSTTLSLAVPPGAVAPDKSFVLSAQVLPGVNGTVTFSANGTILGIVAVAVANSPDGCPSDPAQSTVMLYAQLDQASEDLARSAAQAPGMSPSSVCGGGSFGSATLTVPAGALAVGEHAITATFSSSEPVYLDSEASATMAIANVPPVISDFAPRNIALTPGSRPAIVARLHDPSGVNVQSVHILLDGVDVTPHASVSATSVSYTPAVALAAGAHTVLVIAANMSGAEAQAAWGFSVAAERTYSIKFGEPLTSRVTSPKVSVLVDVGTSEGGVSSVSLNGIAISQVDFVEEVARYGGQLTLAEGQNNIVATAVFDNGQTRSISANVEYDAPPRVFVTSPADKAFFGRALASSPGNLTGAVDRPITITGRVSRPVQSVTINQQLAQLDAAGENFTFTNFFLHEGANLLNVVATDSHGRTGTTTLNLSVDQTAPILRVDSPIPGALTRAGQLDVRGMVNDAVEAGFGAVEPEVFVSVNGQAELPAAVADRYFQLSGVPLAHGLNRLTVRAVDSLGNARTQTIDVHKVDTGLSGLVAAEGQGQSGAGRTELTKPLVVLALDLNGEPVANQAVDFIVERGTGSLSATPGQSASGSPDYTARSIRVITNVQGRASAWFTLGRQSGPGANVVKAAAPMLGGEPVLFLASTSRGEPARITADLGINQIGETEAPVMEILSAVVRDAGDNYLPGIKVQFRVDEGDASFTDSTSGAVAADGQSVVVLTDKNGVAAIRPRIGGQPGVVRLSAQAATTSAADFNEPSGLVGGASYVVRGKQAKDGPASFSGFIYSDKGMPLEGVKASIGRTALLATTDDKGYFEISNVPPGRIDLFVDGRAVNPNNDPTKPQWPSLHFEAYVVRGQKNELPHAIYLPALLVSEAKVVGGNDDVVLTIPGLEGFRMTVKANSVTFPDGSRTGTLIVSPVTADKLPMAPPAGGAQFGVPAWTIQPAGTRFDPPIEVRMPNSTDERPGDNLPVVQWDHDLGQYVPMGRATVSSDGAWLTTDPGSGVTKAGWGGLCRYDECKVAKSPKACGDCGRWIASGKCDGRCEVDPSADGKILPPVVSTQLEFETKMKHDIFQKLERVVLKIFPSELSWKLKDKVTIKQQDECCARKKSTAQTKTLSGTFEVELEFKVRPPLTKHVNIFGEVLDADVDLLTFKAKGLLGGGGFGEYRGCTEQTSVNFTMSAAVTTEFAFAKLNWPKYDPVTKKDPVLELEGIVGATLAGVCKTKASQLEKIFNDCDHQILLYMKADAKAFNRKWTAINLAWPLNPSSTVALDY